MSQTPPAGGAAAVRASLPPKLLRAAAAAPAAASSPPHPRCRVPPLCLRPACAVPDDVDVPSPDWKWQIKSASPACPAAMDWDTSNTACAFRSGGVNYLGWGNGPNDCVAYKTDTEAIIGNSFASLCLPARLDYMWSDRQ